MSIFIDSIEIEGKFSFTAAVDRSKKPPILTIEGFIETEQRLPDQFATLSGGRHVLKNILISAESGGSEDNNIVYAFSARSYEIK